MPKNVAINFDASPKAYKKYLKFINVPDNDRNFRLKNIYDFFDQYGIEIDIKICDKTVNIFYWEVTYNKLYSTTVWRTKALISSRILAEKEAIESGLVLLERMINKTI